MNVLMRTKIRTQLGCVNVVCSTDPSRGPDAVLYTASILVRDGVILQYKLAYAAMTLPGNDSWDYIKSQILQALSREAFKEML